MTFWVNEPLILFRHEHLSFWPSSQQTFSEKLNSMTRLILVLTLLGYIVSRSIPIVITGSVSLGLLVVLYYVKTKEGMTPNMRLHHVMGDTKGSPTLNTVQDSSLDTANRTHWYPQHRPSTHDTHTSVGNGNPVGHEKHAIHVDRADKRPREAREQAPTKTNPMMNVMMTDYKDRPHRPRAQPAFSPNVRDAIHAKTKESIEENLEQKLFHDLGDEINFEHAMNRFTTNPSTTIVNDQKAFAEFCYGNMSSCKDGEVDKCFSNETKLGQVYA